MIGETIGGELGLLERASPPFAVQTGRWRGPLSASRHTSRSAEMPITTTRETGNGR